MSVRLKLMTIVLFVALVPVSISAYTMLSVHQESSSQTLAALHQKTAELGASQSRGNLDNGIDVLSGLIRDRIDWPALTETERTQVLWLVYEQLEGVVVASLLDESGRGIGSSVYRSATLETESLRSRPVMSNTELSAYGKSLPIAEALRDGQAIGPALPPTGDRGAIIPLAFSVAGPTGKSWLVGVGISLTQVCQRLGKGRAPDTDVALLDSSGAHLCHGDASTATVGAKLTARLPLAASTTMRYMDTNQQDVLAAAAPGGADWTVLTTQRVSSAIAPTRRIQKQMVFWIGFGVLGALVAGVFLARGITQPIASLSEATKKIAAGKYDIELTVDGRDEFAQLSTAFNTMCGEIKAWNTELNNRVDERTQALSETQGQLLESKKMAAVASMSAGIAHEINNPLTAVLTFAQVLEARAKKDPSQEKLAKTLKTLGDNALRIRDIVQRMQRLTEESEEGMIDKKLSEVIGAATKTVQERLIDGDIELVLEHEPELPLVYVRPGEIHDALVHIFDNSIKALQGERGVLTVSTKKVGDSLVQIDITDTGKGIPADAIGKIFEPFFTLKDQWQGQGLGLAEAHQIITSNHGTVKARSAIGEGTTITIIFPVTTQRAHLA